MALSRPPVYECPPYPPVLTPRLAPLGLQEPLHVEARLNLATIFEEDGRSESALHQYKRALQADPLAADTHVSLALLYEKLGLPRRARQHWGRYLQLDPEGSWADVARRHLDA